MDELQLLLKKKINELSCIINMSEACISHAPEGLLHINKKKNTIQFYKRTNRADTHGIYIRKTEKELIHQLAQKEYAKKIQAKALEERANLLKCLEQYNPDALLDTYRQINENKQYLIQPYVLTDEEYVTQWYEEKIKIKEQHGKDDLSLVPEEEAIVTEQGERVRSKSEKILADKLKVMGVPYIYECPLFLKGYNYVRPDFTVLNVRTRKEIIWEHLGLMDQKEYCEKAIKKIESYEKNDIYVGKSLILTFETEKYHLNTKNVEKLILEYLI